MSTTLTSPDIILLIQITSIIGYLILFGYTLISYKKIKNPTLLYISFAFAIIAISILLKITVLPFEAFFIIEKEYVEAIFEGTQFLAAFLFFYGLRIIRQGKEGDQ